MDSNPVASHFIRHRRTPERLEIETGLLRLAFDLGKGVRLAELATPDGPNWIDSRGAPPDLWSLRFRGPDGLAPEYVAGNADFENLVVYESKENRLRVSFDWSIRLTPKGRTTVNMTLALDAARPLVEWELTASLPKGWRLHSAEFPRLARIRTEQAPRLAVASGYGADYELARGFAWEGPYPSCFSVMQFVAFHGQGEALYLAAHDPNAHLKTFRVNAENGHALFRLETPLALPEETGGVVTIPYTSVLALIPGGWMEAARLYREFATTTPWAQGPRADKAPRAKWIREIDLWIRPDGAAEDNIAPTREALDYFGPGTACHWYRWHETPYDTHYPEYFPALPGFAEGIRTLQDAGAPVVPYINGRLWDPASRRWRERRAAESAARKDNGDCYNEIYGSRIPNTVMCPTTPLWRETIAAVAGRLRNEFGVAGVYIDQIAAAQGVPCYAPGHGHPPGGGTHWVEGYRALLDAVREKVGDDCALVTEENAECWIDRFDALILVNSPAGSHLLPLFPLVYSDRIAYYAYLYYAPEEPVNGLSFRYKNRRAFLWGAQLGWMQPARLMALAVRAEAEFLRNLARARRRARPWLVGGRFLRPLDVGGDNPTLDGRGEHPFGGSWELRTPAVEAALWLGPEGDPMILAANLDDAPRTVRIPLTIQDAECVIPATGPLAVLRSRDEDVESAPAPDEPAASIEPASVAAPAPDKPPASVGTDSVETAILENGDWVVTLNAREAVACVPATRAARR